MNANVSAPRQQGILSLKFKDVNSLYISYMPFLKTGGLFAPTAQRYGLGDEVTVLVTLIDDNERLAVAGKVVWITPVGAQGNRTAGVGIQFNESPESEAARQRIEGLLAGTLTSERPTQTM